MVMDETDDTVRFYMDGTVEQNIAYISFLKFGHDRAQNEDNLVGYMILLLGIIGGEKNTLLK